MKRKINRKNTSGSVSIEYIVIVSFSSLIALGSLAYVAHTMQSKLEQIHQKFGEEAEDTEFLQQLDNF